MTSVVTLIGLPLAIYGIARTARASVAGRRGSERAARILRTAELRESLQIALDATTQLMTFDRRGARSARDMTTRCHVWMKSQRRVFALLREQADAPEGMAFRVAMQAATVEVDVALDAASSAGARWERYHLPVLRRKLQDYAETAEALLKAADDGVLNA